MFFSYFVISAYAGDILSTHKYLLSAYYGPGNVLGNAKNVMSKTEFQSLRSLYLGFLYV